ncbi:MAG: flavin reductase family protein [Ignavibacteria bacterium]|nr:flavin reductase family protein [Ignavibacteria bacterium]
MVVDPKTTNEKNLYKLMIGCIVPRPIAFISTTNTEEGNNLAPFSFFMGVGANPPSLAISISKRGNDGGTKDTLKNILEMNEFVVNVVTEEIAEQMNITSAEFPSHIDEFIVSKLTPIPSAKVRPPRVKESPINMECRMLQSVTVGDSTIIIGEIVYFHIAEDVFENYRIDISELHPIGRLAGDHYSRTRDIFDLVRPKT